MEETYSIAGVVGLSRMERYILKIFLRAVVFIGSEKREHIIAGSWFSTHKAITGIAEKVYQLEDGRSGRLFSGWRVDRSDTYILYPTELFKEVKGVFNKQ